MRLLLLAGISDAVQIAWALAQDSRVIATASIARPGITPVSLGLPTRIGGWPDEGAFRDWLQSEGIEAILDASHPFSSGITRRAVRISAELGLDYLQFSRPPWLPGPGDRWTFLNSCDEIDDHVPIGKRVLIDTNAYGAERMGDLDGRRVFFRVSDRQPDVILPDHWVRLVARHRLTLADEMRGFTALGVDWLMTLNAGGIEETPKLDAARRLGLSVAMVRRPPHPEAPRVSSVSEVLNWVRRRV